MEIAIKAALGALVAIAIHYAARSRQPHLAALVPLFPTFMLFAQTAFIASARIEEFRAAAQFGLLSLLPYAAYLATVWYANLRMGPLVSLAMGVIAWSVTASVLVWSWWRD